MAYMQWQDTHLSQHHCRSKNTHQERRAPQRPGLRLVSGPKEHTGGHIVAVLFDDRALPLDAHDALVPSPIGGKLHLIHAGAQRYGV